MNIAELEERYRTLSEDELLQLRSDLNQLSAEAKIALENELSRRWANHERLGSLTADSRLEHQDEKNESWAFPSVRRLRATLRDWRDFRDRTGNWPLLTIGFSFCHLFTDLATLALLIWYSEVYRWTKVEFVLVILPLTLVDVLLSDWLARRIRIFELTRYRHRSG
jgi:hypothetical protein